jgi:glyoxylase-like metal-dependent hydrolase (beta-lactamase superfamily II)
MSVATFALGPWVTNSHILYREGRALVIDAGAGPQELIDFLGQQRLSVSHILITHLHSDHLYGVAALQQATGARVLVPEGEGYLRGTSDAEGGDGWPRVTPFSHEPLPLGDQILGGFALRVFATPGHTRGSVSLYCPEEQAVFSGDVLFYRAVGRTDFLGGDRAALLHSIRQGLFSLPEETRVYSGHGPVTSIGEEKKHNPLC